MDIHALHREISDVPFSCPEQHEENPGAVVWKNNDFSKMNESADGSFIPDFLKDAGTHHYEFDPEYLHDYTPATVTWPEWMTPNYDIKLDFPSSILVWDVTAGQQPGVGPPRLTSGVQFRPASDHLTLWVEGLNGSGGLRADSITASAIRRATGGSQPPLGSAAPQGMSDMARFTIVEVNAGLDGNRDGKIDYADYADHEMTFWYNDNRDWWQTYAGGTGIIFTGGPSVGSRDAYNSGLMTNRRDLEDYAPYYLAWDDNLKAVAHDSGYTVECSLRIVDAAGSSVTLFPKTDATGDAESYLRSDNAAEQQADFTHPIFTLMEFETSIRSQMETWWNSTESAREKRLVFDAWGTEQTNPELVFTVKVRYPDGRQVLTTRTDSLELRRITDFYDRWEVTPDRERSDISVGSWPDAALVSSSQVRGQRSLDGNEYVVFVHGWNMAQDDKEMFAQTMYKRLYWEGYAGRFGSFNWPTYYDEEGSRRLPFLNWLAAPNSEYAMNYTYNASELQAFRSGRALKNLIANLDARLGPLSCGPIGGNISIFAHSMGNIVVGEALRQWAVEHPGQRLAKSYVAMEGAVSAGAYGHHTVQVPLVGTYSTDLYGYWSSGQSEGAASDRGLFENTADAVANWVNFYNPVDYATATAWPLNVRFLKLSSLAICNPPADIWPYWYMTNDLPGGIVYGRVYNDTQTLIRRADFVDAAGEPGTYGYEVIAFCAQANTKPIGTQPVDWFGTNNVDIKDLGLGDLHRDARENHSFQFHHDAAITHGFYQALLARAGLATTR
jgi:hypothetical protein